MASEQQVKQYLAYWFQLGKRVIVENGLESMLPSPIISNNHYSDEFENCWQVVLAKADSSYLEGTDQTIATLLTPKWDLTSCVRCSMPVPMPNLGIASSDCPCSDLMGWPNMDLPLPRSPVNSETLLSKIQNRIIDKHQLQN